jgi:hypothetical protein
LVPGWNLVGSADKKTPAELARALHSSLNSVNKSISTVWAWDAVNSSWRFYAPALEVQGGSVLSSYISSKNYQSFVTSIAPTDGFWVNVTASVPADNTLDSGVVVVSLVVVGSQ